jgi:hypothetical protein
VIATWPVGETVTALAADADRVVIGDAAGVVCLRRRDDGAMLQCVTAADGPITSLAIAGAVVRVDAGDRARAFSLPSLAASPTVPPPAPAPPRDLLARVPVGGTIRHARLSPAGLVVAAWIGGLDDPSVILTPRACAN